jgi:hypothetical protein
MIARCREGHAGPVPRDDGYGRVTNPERYLPLHREAEVMVDELIRVYDVSVERGGPELDPELAPGADRLVRLSAGGEPLTIAWTSFPGVILRVGAGQREGFPRCGCDACDERVDELMDELRRRLEEIAAEATWRRRSPST